MRTKFIFLCLICVMTFIFVSCAKPSEENMDNSLTLRVATHRLESSNFHPTTAVRDYERDVAGLIYEPLLKTDNGKFVYILTESYQISPDDKKVKFALRPQVKWHNGASFTANDVVFSVTKGFGETYQNANSSIEIIPDIKVIDDLTVEFFSLRGSDYILNQIATKLLIFPNPDVTEKDNEENEKSYQQNFIGTGPFCFIDFSLGNHVRLMVNKNYWGDVPNLERIILKDIGNEDLFYLMEKGSISLAKEALLNQTAQNKADKIDAKIVKSTEKHQLSLFLNNKNHHLKNQPFRKALLYSLKRTDFAPTFNSEIANMPLYTENYEGTPPIEYTFNHEMAIELFSKLGYTKQQNVLFSEQEMPVKFTLIYTEKNEFTRLYPALIKRDLLELGIEIETILLSEEEFYERIISGNYDMALCVIPPLSLHELSDFFYSKNIGYLNFTRYKNPVMDIYIEQISSGDISFETRDKVLNQLNSDLPMLPLINFNDIFIIAEN